jgi:subtilase family serine protease
VYYNNAWYVVGGTSLAAPLLAGIMNNSNNRLGVAPSGGGYYTNAENNLLYAELLTNKEFGKNFYDVTTGSNGSAATVGYDTCTGVGSPRGKNASKALMQTRRRALAGATPHPSGDAEEASPCSVF